MEKFEIDVKIQSRLVLQCARGSHQGGEDGIQVMECPYCGKKDAFIVKTYINESGPITYRCNYCGADGILDDLTLYHLGIDDDSIFARYPYYKRDLQEFAYRYMDKIILSNRATVYWLHQCVDTEDELRDTIDESRDIIEKLNNELDRLAYNPLIVLIYMIESAILSFILVAILDIPWQTIPIAAGCSILLYHATLCIRRRMYYTKHKPLVKRAARVYDDTVTRLIAFRMSKMPKQTLSNVSPFFHNREDIETILDLFLKNKAHTLMDAYQQIPTIHGINPKDPIDSFAPHDYESKTLLEDCNYLIQKVLDKCKRYDDENWAS